MHPNRFFSSPPNLTANYRNESVTLNSTADAKLDFIISDLQEQRKVTKYLQEQNDQALSLVDQTVRYAYF